MKLRAVTFTVVAALAVCVGVFVGLLVYATLVAAVIFLVVAAVSALLFSRRNRRRALRDASSLQSRSELGVRGRP